MSEEEIKFRAYLLTLNSEFPTHRKTEAMEELLKIYHKQQKEIEELKKGVKSLMESRKKWRYRYNKEKEKNKELEKLNLTETTLYADGKIINKTIQLEDYISKDKIKEKIKEYLQNGMWEHQNAIDFILQELLEEKKNDNERNV